MPSTATGDWDDEDWHDHDAALDDGDPVPCPECGKPVYDFVDHCPACGYWITSADREAHRSGTSQSGWLRTTAIIVLIVMLVSLFAGGMAFF